MLDTLYNTKCIHIILQLIKVNTAGMLFAETARGCRWASSPRLTSGSLLSCHSSLPNSCFQPAKRVTHSAAPAPSSVAVGTIFAIDVWLASLPIIRIFAFTPLLKPCWNFE